MTPIATVIADKLRVRGIRLIRDEMPVPLKPGMIVWGTGVPSMIVVDRDVQDPKELAEISMHEIVHFDRGDGFLPDEVAEAAARRGTLICCASVDRLAQAYAAGCPNPKEYSEMLGMPERTCAGALALLKEMFGNQVVRVGRWVCTSDPFRARCVGGIMAIKRDTHLDS